ncbi:chromosome partitioning protein [Sphingobium boeckii]|uniref:Chromosome partitioning protein n=2 Tax=Sphingobium boeckii TaxID=1082345 RepID=A0A7W9EDW4_9SPHN|nr:chromosome partitioning protein [Sphingobium boeckii]
MAADALLAGRNLWNQVAWGPWSDMAGNGVHLIVFANEKGGSGKSTTAVHTAIALAKAGRTVAALDLDTRQRTMSRYLENREATARKRGIELTQPRYVTLERLTEPGFDQEVAQLARGAEFVVIDTPGRDDPLARHAASRADTIVTPINDSFIDLDLIGQVDSETFKVKKPSFYSEIIWDARKARAKADGGTVDWVVLRNRLQHVEARNMRRVGLALAELSKRVGFRVIPGLSERVIYRELFPKGITLLDLEELGELGISHIAARQELREMVSALALPEAQPMLAL